MKCLYLRQCHLSDNEATKSFLHAVQNTCKNIESIDLSENKCCAEVIAMLTKMKLHSTCYPTCEPEESDELLSLLKARDTVWERLENVDLSETVITEPHGVNAVCCMIESLPNLYHFNIMNCKVNDEDCQQKLIRSLSENGMLLQTLNLGGNSLRENSINTLQEAVSNFSNLQSLNLSSCEKDCDNGFRGIVDALNKPQTCSKLTKLDFSNNVCDPETIAKLAIFCHKTDVKAGYPTCQSDAEAVITYLRDHTDWQKIQYLNLSEKTISRSALIGLASVTPYMLDLQELLFSRCKACDNLEFANLIQSFEAKAPKIKHIDFSSVPLTGEPIEAVAKLMCKESCLEILNLENCELMKEKQFEYFTKQLADSCSNLKTLNISNNPIHDDGFAAMAGTLKNLQNIETLLLEETEMTCCSEVISAIRENCKHIHTLSLRGNSASMVDIFELTKMIVDKRIERKNLQYPDCPHTKSPKLLDMIKSENTPWEKLVKIDLAQEIIPEDGVQALVMVLQVTKEAKEINLNGCRFEKPEATNEILKVISCNCASLVSLDISKTFITKEGSQHVTKIIEFSGNLSTLNISNCDIVTEACDAIITSIAKREQPLRSVNFSGTKASPKSIVALTKIKMKGCSLSGSYPSCSPQEDERLISILQAKVHTWDIQEEIDISNPEHMSSEGFCALVEVIKESPKLTSLNLESCGIKSDDNISRCLEALNGKAVNLKMLNLTNNHIGSNGWESLVNVSSTFPSLLHLYLRNTKIDKFNATFAEKFGKLSGNLTHLKTLDVSGNSFGTFSAELPKLFSKLEKLHLEDCKLQDSDVLQISAKIKGLQNNSLVHLNLSKNRSMPKTLVHLSKLGIKTVKYPKCESSPEPPELIEIFCNGGNRWQNMGIVKIQKISQNGIDALVDIFGRAKGIHSLDMYECLSDTPLNVENLLGALKENCTELHTFRIGSIKIEQNVYPTICDILNNSSGIKTFAISKCSISYTDAMMQILDSLRKHKDFLEDLDISGNQIGSGIKNLTHLSGESKKLKKISIANCNCDNTEQLKKLVENLAKKKTLELVDLMGEIVLLDTFMELKKMQRSKNVTVGFPTFKDAGALAKYCKEDEDKICILNLKDEPLTSESFKSLMILCEAAQNLETLWLPPSPDMKDANMASLLYSCKPGRVYSRYHKKLTDLDVSKNVIGEKTIKEMDLKPLYRLRLAGCNLTEKDSVYLVVKLCEKAANLEVLDLSNNPLGKQSVEKFLKKDEGLQNLQKLYLSNCSIPIDLMPEFVKCISEKCKALKELDLSENSCTADVLVQLTIIRKERAFTPKYPECTGDTAEFVEFCKDTKNEWSEIEHLGKEKYLQKMSYKGSVALGMIFKYTRELKSLELAKMSDTILPVIQSLVENCHSLERLVFADTDFCSTTEKQWKELFILKMKLVHIKYLRCKLFCQDGKSICHALRSCHQLRILDLSDSCITLEGKQHLNTMLFGRSLLG